MKSFWALAISLIAAVMMCNSVNAATLYVDVSAAPGGDGSSAAPFQSIQAAINVAVASDNIEVAPGTYFEQIDFLGKDIVVQSSDPSDPSVVAGTIIDAASAGTVVTMASGEPATAMLAGFTIQAGSWTDQTQSHGGGVHIENASPVIVNNVIRNCYTRTDGGGICILGNSAPSIDGNTIQYNQADGWGGGIFVFGDTSDPENVLPATPIIARNRVSYNEAEWDGGGIACFEACPTTLKANVVDHNTSGQVGGGVFVGFGVQADLQNNTVAHNEALGSDVADPNGPVQRVGVGGGLAFWFGEATATLNSSIIWGNTSKNNEGPQASLEGTSGLTVSFCDIEGGQAGVYAEAGASLTWGAANLDQDPLFAGPDDYHVLSVAGRYDPTTGTWVKDAVNSPCIDSGDGSLPVENEPNPHGALVNQGGYGTTVEASKTEGLPFTVGFAKSHEWTYQNRPISTNGNGNHLLLFFWTLGDNNPNTSYSLTFTQIGGDGSATYEQVDGTTWRVVGSDKYSGSIGEVQVQVEVAGNVGGTGSDVVTFTVRQIGDVDGNESVQGVDKLALNNRLNGVDTGYLDRAFDFNGDGSVGGADKQMMNSILNGAFLP